MVNEAKIDCTARQDAKYGQLEKRHSSLGRQKMQVNDDRVNYTDLGNLQELRETTSFPNELSTHALPKNRRGCRVTRQQVLYPH